MMFIIGKEKRLTTAQKLIEQQKGVVNYWRDLWLKDRENGIGMNVSDNYKMYTMQLSKLNAYDYMYFTLAGNSEEFDLVEKMIEA